MNWLTKESEHYCFHFRKESFAQEEIDQIIVKQESCYLEICERFGWKTDFKILYFLHSTPEGVGKSYGDDEPCNGFAKAPNIIHAVYNLEIQCIGFHEDVHILSYHMMGRPNQKFIREGLANYFDQSWWHIDLMSWVKVSSDMDRLPSVSELILNESFATYPERISYPLSGAFTAFIIDTYGINKYVEWFKTHTESPELTFESIFGVTLEQTSITFEKSLQSYKVTEEDRYEILKSFWNNH